MEEFEIVGVTTAELIAILEIEAARADYDSLMAEVEMGLYEGCVKRGGL